MHGLKRPNGSKILKAFDMMNLFVTLSVGKGLTMGKKIVSLFGFQPRPRVLYDSLTVKLSCKSCEASRTELKLL